MVCRRLALLLGVAVALLPFLAAGQASGRTSDGLVWGERTGVYSTNASGSGKRLITSFPPVDDKYGWDEYRRPTWSPSGRLVAYATCASATCLVHVVPRGDGKGVTLPAPTGTALNPTWAPDGGQIAFENFPTGCVATCGGYISVVSFPSKRIRTLVPPKPGRRDTEPAIPPKAHRAKVAR